MVEIPLSGKMIVEFPPSSMEEFDHGKAVVEISPPLDSVEIFALPTTTKRTSWILERFFSTTPMSVLEIPIESNGRQRTIEIPIEVRGSERPTGLPKNEVPGGLWPETEKFVPNSSEDEDFYDENLINSRLGVGERPYEPNESAEGAGGDTGK